jgi:glycosyltransferase involved in cell wall biosynthesis
LYTWFHDSDEDPGSPFFMKKISESLPNVRRIVTSCSIAKERLQRWGVPEEKIAMIPLEVDLSIFHPGTETDRRNTRASLSIDDDAICIGYFQKDGVGWGEGLEPKLIKGPDIFLFAIAKLADHHKIFVLLTGPARGYVKKGLYELGVSYHHTFFENYFDVVHYYRCLDMYLVTSRDEGGPKAILDSIRVISVKTHATLTDINLGEAFCGIMHPATQAGGEQGI